MSQQPPEVEFAKSETDKIEQFCQDNFEENKDACVARVQDKLVDKQKQPEQGPEQKQDRQSPTVNNAARGEEPMGDEGIESLVADCVGGGFLGLHRPDQQACFRAVAQYERERNR